MHSGLHKGGAPKYPEIQEHTATLFTCLHWLFGPQGDGAHGLIISIDAKSMYTYLHILRVLVLLYL